MNDSSNSNTTVLPPAPGKPTEPLGLVSLILGCISLIMNLTCCMAIIGIPLAIIAVVLGVLSRNKQQKEPNIYSGQNLATIGIATGAAGLIIFLLLFLFGAVTGGLKKLNEPIRVPFSTTSQDL